MQFGTPAGPQGPTTYMEAAQFLGRSFLIELAGVQPVSYSVTSVNSLPIAVEVAYGHGSADASIRNWSLGDPRVDFMYPETQVRIDEHFMNHLANVMHVPDVINTFSRAERLETTATVSLDGEKREAEVYEWRGVRGLVFTEDDVTVSYVSEYSPSPLSFQHHFTPRKVG